MHTLCNKSYLMTEETLAGLSVNSVCGYKSFLEWLTVHSGLLHMHVSLLSSPLYTILSLGQKKFRQQFHLFIIFF